MEIQRRQDMGVQFQAKEIKLSQITLVIVGGMYNFFLSIVIGSLRACFLGRLCLVQSKRNKKIYKKNHIYIGTQSFIVFKTLGTIKIRLVGAD